MNKFKTLGIAFWLVLFSSITLQAQIITFQAGYVRGPSPDFNICVPDGISTIVIEADTMPNAGSHIRHYVWNVDGVSQSNDTKTLNLPLNSNSSHVYNIDLQLNNGLSAKITAQNNFTFKIHHTPPTPVEINPNPQIVYKGITQYNLLNAFSSGVNSSKYTYSFTGDHTSNGGDFDKNSPVGEYHIFHYTANDNGFCQIGDSLYSTTIKVVDDKASLPTFIKSFEPLPICGDRSLVLLAALINPACTTATTPIIFVTDGIKSDVPTVLFQSVDEYTGAIMYFFYLKPNLFASSSVKITITSTCPNSSHYVTYTGDIPITPLQAPSILGLPAPTGAYINLCSSSSDTVFLRGNPSGIQGKYFAYRGHPLVPGDPGYIAGDTTFTLMNDSVLSYSTAYVPPANDPTLRKFTPMDLFGYIKDKPDDVIRIIYNSPPPCQSSRTVTIKFLPSVAVTFDKPADTVCYGKPVRFNVIGNPIGNPDQYFWNFGDGSTYGYLSDTIVYHNYEKPGMYIVRFRTQVSSLSTGSCNNDVIDTIWVGAQPKAEFEVRQNFQNVNAIFSSKASILLNNIPSANDTINKWEYVFEPGISVSQNIPDATHTYAAVQKNPYQVLHIATARWGCKDTAVRYIPIFPVRIPTPAHSESDYFTQTDINGWYESGQYKNADTASSWQNRTPQSSLENTIVAYPSGGDAWITGENKDPGSGYYNNEKSWVESPVYDISQLKLPMVSLNTWTNFDNLFDGVALQYTFCDTAAFGREQWHTLGDKAKGLDWYTSNSIIGAPGGTLTGWTNDTLKNWRLSAYRLSDIQDTIAVHPQKKLIRFRIVTGTNNDNTPGKTFDGFAFDNFFVGERNRRVIVEEFCDYLPQHYIPDINNHFKDPQTLRIQYHVRTLTTNDDINNQNMAEPGARALLYGIGMALPRGVIDGIFEDNNHDFLSWGEDAFFRRSLVVAPFNINVAYTASDKLYITASLKKIVSSSKPKNYIVQVAVLEKEVTGNGVTFTNVLRNLVPNSAGTRIDASYAWPNDSASVSVKWSPFVQPLSDLRIVVFIQDEDTREIYQSNYDSVPYSQAHLLPTFRFAGSSGSSVSFNEADLFPNPTSGDLKVSFNGILKENYTWTITDALGTAIKSDVFNNNIKETTISTFELPVGMYFLKIEGEGQRMVKKFSVIR